METNTKKQPAAPPPKIVESSGKTIVNSAMLFKTISVFKKVMVKQRVVKVGRKTKRYESPASLLPVLSYVLVEINNPRGSGSYTFNATCSNLDIFLSTSFSCDADGSFRFMMPATVINLLKRLPSQPVTLDYDHKSEKLTIRTEYDTFIFKTLPVGGFPKTLEFENPDTKYMACIYATGVKAFYKALSKHKNFRGNDELRLNLTGTYLEFYDGKMIVTSTDANCLYTTTHPGAEGNHTGFAIVKASTCNLLLTLPTETLEIEQCGEWLKFNTGEYILIARNIEEKYPDYRVVIPNTHTNKVEIDKANLLRSIGNAMFCANNYTKQGVFDFKPAIENTDGDKLTLSSSDFDSDNEYSGNIDCNLSGDPIKIGFNLRFIKKAIEAMPEETITIEYGYPAQAAIIKNETDLVLVMPMMLNS